MPPPNSSPTPTTPSAANIANPTLSRSFRPAERLSSAKHHTRINHPNRRFVVRPLRNMQFGRIDSRDPDPQAAAVVVAHIDRVTVDGTQNGRGRRLDRWVRRRVRGQAACHGNGNNGYGCTCSPDDGDGRDRRAWAPPHCTLDHITHSKALVNVSKAVVLGAVPPDDLGGIRRDGNTASVRHGRGHQGIWAFRSHDAL